MKFIRHINVIITKATYLNLKGSDFFYIAFYQSIVHRKFVNKLLLQQAQQQNYTMDINQLVSKHQSIKIVPSTEDSLRSIGLNVDLDDNSKLWFEQLKATWKTWKKSPAIESHIEVFFQSKPDPYRLALVFVIKCEDFKDCKPKSLPYFIVETLHKFSQASGVIPEESLKLPAFRIATQQRSQLFVALVVKTYQLTTIKQTILPHVKDMIKNDNCKQASQIVIAMELSDDVPVEDLLFPLILQDKSSLIDEYLTECPSQVRPLLLFLDKLLDKSFNIRDYVQNYIDNNNISHVKYEKIHYKPLGKLVARLCNKFNIPIETCKNLSKNRTTGGLRYLIHQKYLEHNVSSSVWDDLVKDSLKQNVESGQAFIDMLVDYDKNEAIKWASYLNIPESDLPLALRELSLNSVPEEETWDTDVNASQEYYRLSLPEDQISIIDTAEKFYEIIISELAKCSVVSIDCEWKPSFGAAQSQVALIQVAVSDRVYLIDTMILNKPHYSSFWCNFYKSFLDNAEIIKIGFGLEQDLKEIKSSVMGLGNIKVKGEGLLDLGTLWKSLLSNGLIIPGNSDHGGNSLSSVVQSCFGKPLEKSEQCSNWELRPLRNTQILYAALDAHVLVEIYEFLQKLCLEQGIKFEEICNDVMLEGKKKSVKKPKVIDRIQSYVPVQKSAHEVKMIVEPVLSNLMPFLRYCGIDTIVMSSSSLWHDVINLAISEDRLILVSKHKCTPTVNFPQSSILEVSNNTVVEQLRKIFTSFNVSVEENKLFNFCINCNEKSIKKLDASEVLEICNRYRMAEFSKPAQYDDYDDEETGYENFLSDSDCDDDLYQPAASVLPKIKCTTSKSVLINIESVHKLYSSPKPAILCDSCGKLFWDEDKLLRSVSDTVFNLTKLKLW